MGNKTTITAAAAENRSLWPPTWNPFRHHYSPQTHHLPPASEGGPGGILVTREWSVVHEQSPASRSTNITAMSSLWTPWEEQFDRAQQVKPAALARTKPRSSRKSGSEAGSILKKKGDKKKDKDKDKDEGDEDVAGVLRPLTLGAPGIGRMDSGIDALNRVRYGGDED